MRTITNLVTFDLQFPTFNFYVISNFYFPAKNLNSIVATWKRKWTVILLPFDWFLSFLFVETGDKSFIYLSPPVTHWLYIFLFLLIMATPAPIKMNKRMSRFPAPSSAKKLKFSGEFLATNKENVAPQFSQSLPLAVEESKLKNNIDTTPSTPLAPSKDLNFKDVCATPPSMSLSSTELINFLSRLQYIKHPRHLFTY